MIVCCLRYRYLFVGEKAGWYDVAKKSSNRVWIPATKMTVSPVCLYPNVNGGSRFNLSSTDIAGLIRSWILFRRDMAAGGIPWIPEFWIAIIFIVCQRVLLRIKIV